MTSTLTSGSDPGRGPLLAGLSAPGTPDVPIRIGDDALPLERLLAASAVVADRVAGARAVALAATASLETVIGVVGCLRAGVPVVPVPPDSGAERAHIVADSGADQVLSQLDLADLAHPATHATLATRHASSSGGDLPEPPPEATALVLYTSGTTGPPKGVPITRAAIAAGLDALYEAWAWTPHDRLVHGLPLFHVHGLVLGVLGPLRLGGSLVHTGRPAPERYAAAGGTLYFGVPTVWSRIAAEPEAARALSGARLLVSGSAPLPVPVFERLAQLTGQPPVERYGMTETLITVSGRAAGPRRAGFVGTPLTGVATRLVDDDGQPLPRDGAAVGEVQVRAPMVFGGYLGRPDATAASFTPDGWFRTGDVATIDPDGWHRIVGRASTDLIKSGGYRIGAGEVEDSLLAHPAVREVAVVGEPDADLGQRVTAYVVASGVSEQELIAHVAGQLSVHKRPRRVVFVDALPRNPIGKVLKKQLG